MKTTTFDKTALYKLMIGDATLQDFARYQANTYFRSRRIRKPMSSEWVELSGEFDTPPQTYCIRDGEEIQFREGEYMLPTDETKTIRFWFGQSTEGIIYYAFRGN